MGVGVLVVVLCCYCYLCCCCRCCVVSDASLVVVAVVVSCADVALIRDSVRSYWINCRVCLVRGPESDTNASYTVNKHCWLQEETRTKRGLLQHPSHHRPYSLMTVGLRASLARCPILFARIAPTRFIHNIFSKHERTEGLFETRPTTVPTL